MGDMRGGGWGSLTADQLAIVPWRRAKHAGLDPRAIFAVEGGLTDAHIYQERDEQLRILVGRRAAINK